MHPIPVEEACQPGRLYEAANLLLFTRNLDDAEDVARYLDDNKLLICLGAVAVGIAGLGSSGSSPSSEQFSP